MHTFLRKFGIGMDAIDMYIYIIICTLPQRYILYDILIYFRHLPMKVSQLLTISPVGQKCGGSMINSNVDLGCSNNDNNISN